MFCALVFLVCPPEPKKAKGEAIMQSMKHAAADLKRAEQDHISPYSTPKTWLLVADEKIARIFAKQGKQLEAIDEMQSTLPVPIGIGNDTVGRGGAAGSGRHKYEPSMEESRQEQTMFAREIGEVLSTALNKGDFQRLLVVAAPAMLGYLRENMPRNVKNTIAVEANKQLTSHTKPELERELNEFLRLH